MKLSSRVVGRTPLVLTLAVTALAVTACGGGGSGSPTPQNAAPTISALSPVTTNQDTPTAAMAFTVADDGGVAALTVTAASGNPDIVRADGITLGGSGANRTITVKPSEDATGNAVITVSATDAQGLTTTLAFGVAVNAVTRSITAYVNTVFALGANDPPAQVSGFTFTQDADDPATFAPLLQ